MTTGLMRCLAGAGVLSGTGGKRDSAMMVSLVSGFDRRAQDGTNEDTGTSDETAGGLGRMTVPSDVLEQAASGSRHAPASTMTAQRTTPVGIFADGHPMRLRNSTIMDILRRKHELVEITGTSGRRGLRAHARSIDFMPFRSYVAINVSPLASGIDAKRAGFSAAWGSNNNHSRLAALSMPVWLFPEEKLIAVWGRTCDLFEQKWSRVVTVWRLG